MTKPTCPHLWRVDSHFAGKIATGEEAEMRRHLLEGCEACKFRYTRLAMVSKVVGGSKAEDRIAAGLGFAGRRRAWGWPALVGALAACAMVVVVLVGRKGGDGFASRGPGVASAELRVFRVGPAGSEPVVRGIRAGDELAFAYRNGAGKKHLFVFGVDEHRHVYWFFPAWKSASEQPAAPVVVSDGVFHEIEDAVGHGYDGSKLDVYGVFTDRPWRVQEIEAVVSAAPPGAPLAFDDGVVTVQQLSVTR